MVGTQAPAQDINGRASGSQFVALASCGPPRYRFVVSLDRVALPSVEPIVERYLDLLARVLTRYELDAPYIPLDPIRRSARVQRAWRTFDSLLARKKLALVKRKDTDKSLREQGIDAPGDGETMIGLHRLQNLREAVRTIIAEDVPGDILEAGVWRGGASMFMRAALIAYGSPERDVWLADSFAGLPEPDLEKYPQDKDMFLHLIPYMIAPLDRVREGFIRYDLLDDHVHFLKGWFKDTLHVAPVEELALLRVDGDMYESTIQVLDALYHKVAPRGYVIIDDYKAFKECRGATEDFRAAHGITDEIIEVDWTAVYWRKTNRADA